MSCSEKIALKHAAIPLLKKKSFEQMKEGYPIHPKPACNNCLSCDERRDITEYTEIPPLLASGTKKNIKDSRCQDNMLLVMFIILVASATTVAILIVISASQSNIIEEFDYVSRHQWDLNNTHFRNLARLKRPISKIMLLELASDCNAANKTCLNYEEFEDNDKVKMRLKDEVLYNFYQDKDGTIFEGRGWTYQSDCEEEQQCARTATIALIDASDAPASSARIVKLRAFLNFSISNRYLWSCFKVSVKRTDNPYFDDIARALDDMAKEDAQCKYRQ